jgi:allantoicase
MDDQLAGKNRMLFEDVIPEDGDYAPIRVMAFEDGTIAVLPTFDRPLTSVPCSAWQAEALANMLQEARKVVPIAE